MDLSSFVQINALRTPKFDDFTYVLGACYCSEDKDQMRGANQSLLWFTYRTSFPAIGGDGPTTDKGWGCMLRCGQMLMAQALRVVHLGRGWDWTPNADNDTYRRILKMFQDKRTSLFSIQQIAQMGVNEGKRMCEWFGPNTIAQCLKKLAIYDDWTRMVVHVAMDNLMIASDIRTLATTPWRDVTAPEDEKRSRYDSTCSNEPRSDEDSDWRPVLILVPLRLGLTTINKTYLSSLQAFFKLPQCCGIVGGRPNHAVYFVGISGEELFYLDPHTPQYTVDLDKMTEVQSPLDSETVAVTTQDLCEKDSPKSSIENEEPEVLATQEDIEDLDLDEDSPPPQTKLEEAEQDFMDGKGDEDMKIGNICAGEAEKVEDASEEDDQKRESSEGAAEKASKDVFDDSTFHCKDLLYMNFDQLDPSLALGFICQCADDFSDLMDALNQRVLSASGPPLFELLEQRPSNWPDFVPYQGASDPIPVVDYEDFAASDFDSDDNFELLE